MSKPKRRKSDLVDQIKSRETKKEPKQKESSKILLFPTGSTLLNLACSGKTYGGYGAGKMVNLIGDSSAGKTLLALTALAEMAIDPKFDNYRFIYDDVEEAMEMDIPKMFGKRMASRIESPAYDKKSKSPRNSNTVYDFFGNVAKAIVKGEPFIYILDSFDAISTEEDKEMLDDLAKDKDIKESYDMKKQKVSSKMLGNIVGDLRDLQAHLTIISQTRDNVGGMGFGNTKRRSGGRALKFYATHEIWLANEGQIKESKYKRILGNSIQAKITKNKLTGQPHKVSFPIYYNYGVDDIQSCVDFLVDNGFWTKTKGVISAPDFIDEDMKEKNLIALIERDDRIQELRKLVGWAWRTIEKEVAIERRSKYD